MTAIARRLACLLTLLAGVVVSQAAGDSASGTTTSAPVPTYPTYWIKVHGWLMWSSMGLLMPVAIILVRFTKRAREYGDLGTARKLVYTHIFIQVVAVILVICSASVGVSHFDNKFHYTHERLGLSLWLLVWIAPLIGLVRPNHGGRSRPIWYAAHWLAGTGGVILGFINIFIGMNVYELITGKSLRTVNILFAIQLGVMALIYLTQDRWQYLLEQGTYSKTVAPITSGQKTTAQGPASV